MISDNDGEDSSSCSIRRVQPEPRCARRLYTHLLLLWAAAASGMVSARQGYTFYHLGFAGVSSGVHQPLSISSVPQSGSIGTVIGYDDSFSWYHSFSWVGNTLSPLFYSGRVAPTAISPNGAYASLGGAPGPDCYAGTGFVPQQAFNVWVPGGNQCVTFWGVNNNNVFVGDNQLTVNGQSVTQVIWVSCTYNSGCSSIYYDPSSLGGYYSSARAINNLNELVGVATTGQVYSRAFYSKPGSSLLQDFDPKHPAYNSQANAINDSGTAVGTILSGPCPPFPTSCVNSSLNTYPVMFGAGGVTSLGSLGGTQGAALSVNSAGAVVGWSTVSSGQPHGFLYTGGAMIDLNTVPLYDTSNQRVLNWTITEADGINDVGQIVGRAISSISRKEEVVVLVTN
jgi:probable HAF family extracellular repeat protein